MGEGKTVTRDKLIKITKLHSSHETDYNVRFGANTMGKKKKVKYLKIKGSRKRIQSTIRF